MNTVAEGLPQGLKPLELWRLFDTAEAVPLQRPSVRLPLVEGR